MKLMTPGEQEKTHRQREYKEMMIGLNRGRGLQRGGCVGVFEVMFEVWGYQVSFKNIVFYILFE